MSSQILHNLNTYGPEHGRSVVLAHGYGCDQNMWRLVVPVLARTHRVFVFDLAGCGKADQALHDPLRHASLDGHADDICRLIRDLGRGPVIFVGHSVSAMIGARAAIRSPELFETLVMVGPSPCYLNDGDYQGGFSAQDIEGLLDLLDGNHHAWAATMAPLIMGNPDRPELAAELEASFCRMDPAVARVFARVTFTSDCREDLRHLTVPTLILQSQDDAVASPQVGKWVASHIQGSHLVHLGAKGHCPHLSAPAEVVEALHAWLD